jgi:magnesium transporter
VDTSAQTRLIYQIIENTFHRFIYYLRQVDKQSESIQKNLAHSQQNKEILQLLQLQKSVVFFAASLNANFSMMQKIQNNITKKQGVEGDLLDDLLLDARQAIEMCKIYRETIKDIMDAFAIVVNNNQNIIMKFLAAVTIILAVPTLVASYWGMNTGVPFQGVLWGFWIAVAISAVLTGISAIFMAWKKMF